MNPKSGGGGSTKGDVSYVRATPGPQFPIAPSPMPVDGVGNHVPNVAPQQHNLNSDLEDKLELQQRELDELRARASQMEKTMRWWSDCTSNWREKWSKVRNERNKAREENRQLRAKLDLCIKENNNLKREKDELVNSNKSSVNKVSDKHINLPSETTSDVDSQSSSSQPSSLQDLTRSDPAISKTVQSKSPMKTSSSQTSELSALSQTYKEDSETSGEALASDRLALLELKLDESQKTVSGEREEKTHLTKSLDETRHDLNNMKMRYEELKQSKQDAELQVERLKDLHQDDLNRLSLDLHDEQASRTTMDKRLAELRVELETLQRENADEWGKRERLETDKLSIERENKKLRTQIKDLEEQLERKSTHASTVVNKDIKTLQMENSEKTKELADLKHVQSKVKKTLQERTTDLEHSKRRCEQFEMEVKKLRGRVEELKRELANAEDEVDTQTNNVRKVQRNNDELQEQVENLQVQLEHLQSRLRRSSQSVTGTHTAGHRSYSPDLHALEIDEDTDDDFSEGT